MWLIYTRWMNQHEGRLVALLLFFPVVSDTCSSTTQSSISSETGEESRSQVSITSSTTPQTHHVSGFDSN